MKLKLIAFLIGMMVFSNHLFSQDHNVRFAFMGNSITIGAGLDNAPRDCYPSQVQAMLNEIYGDTCIVENYAVSGRTLLKKGDFPLWDELQFPRSLNFAPDIVFILLGTNDTKYYNWDNNKDDFYGDYQAMIDTFKQRNPRCKFIVSYPPPAFEVVYDIRDSVILNGVIPVVDQILANNEAELVDFYYPLLDSIHLFTDFIHPSVEGSKVMAQMVVDKIIESDIVHEVETGFTYVTDITTNNKLLPQNNEVTIGWTTRNADSVFFDGVLVEAEGEMNLTLSETTTITIKAVGQKSTDIMQFTQEVYLPELVKMKLSPASKSILSGETLEIGINFIDQRNKVIVDQTFDVDWSIIEGEGLLENETSSTADVTGTVAGKVVVQAAVGEIVATSRITVKYQTGIDKPMLNEDMIIYPNPAEDFIQIKGLNQTEVQYSLVNNNGQKIESGTLLNGELNLNRIANGIYFLKLNVEDQLFVKKIIVE